MTDPIDRVDMMFQASKAEVLDALTKAHVAMMGAMDAMARRYGRSPHVIQIAGAANMIASDWIPAIEKELI